MIDEINNVHKDLVSAKGTYTKAEARVKLIALDKKSAEFTTLAKKYFPGSDPVPDVIRGGVAATKAWVSEQMTVHMAPEVKVPEASPRQAEKVAEPDAEVPANGKPRAKLRQPPPGGCHPRAGDIVRPREQNEATSDPPSFLRDLPSEFGRARGSDDTGKSGPEVKGSEDGEGEIAVGAKEETDARKRAKDAKEAEEAKLAKEAKEAKEAEEAAAAAAVEGKRVGEEGEEGEEEEKEGKHGRRKRRGKGNLPVDDDPRRCSSLGTLRVMWMGLFVMYAWEQQRNAAFKAVSRRVLGDVEDLQLAALTAGPAQAATYRRWALAEIACGSVLQAALVAFVVQGTNLGSFLFTLARPDLSTMASAFASLISPPVVRAALAGHSLFFFIDDAIIFCTVRDVQTGEILRLIRRLGLLAPLFFFDTDVACWAACIPSVVHLFRSLLVRLHTLAGELGGVSIPYFGLCVDLYTLAALYQSKGLLMATPVASLSFALACQAMEIVYPRGERIFVVLTT